MATFHPSVLTAENPSIRANQEQMHLPYTTSAQCKQVQARYVVLE